MWLNAIAMQFSEIMGMKHRHYWVFNGYSTTMVMRDPVSYLSLFCGCGGFDLGIPRNAFRCVGAYDINKYSVDTYNRNLEEMAKVVDLSKFPISKFPPSQVILSGSPCQGFSTAGKREIKDKRNNLFFRSIDIAIQLKPDVFVAENVPGIASGKFKELFVQKAITRFKRNGYAVYWDIIDCRNLGLPQRRRRFVLIAFRGNYPFIFPESKQPHLPIDSFLTNIPWHSQNHDIEHCMATGEHAKIAQCILPGQKLSNVRGSDRSVHTWHIPKVYGRTSKKERTILEYILKERRRSRRRTFGDADPILLSSIVHWPFSVKKDEIDTLIEKGYLRKHHDDAFDLTNTFNGKYRRLSWGAASPTVDTRFGDPVLFLHPDEDRSLTVREAARIQGFPDDFVFGGPRLEQYRMVGNAVPPQLGAYIARVISKFLEKQS